ncbi:RNA polymerase sigma-70 factor [Chitinophaga lutea]|uniref:RNA polymerase sigma-70 factor n=1 Tax=Chitinophaga lutea TaxID=2488634 RepID=A0A3N4Q0F3_9BACT|nr:RNA polymerase sigma-70 factor [Chitinophaga lutea]RPE09757.1 RNA polymerase sigma-70 factor [Chitinophaga lutea]
MQERAVDDGKQTTAQIFHEYYAALVGYACKFVDPQTAEDLVQDVFIQAHNKIPANAGSYLFRSVHNKCADHFRRLAVHKKYVEEVLFVQEELAFFNPDTGHTSLLEAPESSVWAAIEQLPPKCREIVRLRYEQGMKTPEISTVLGISSRTVETQLYKAMKQLRNVLKRAHGILLNFF